MNIKYKNYLLEQEGDRFNLYRIVIGEGKKNKGMEIPKPIGYSYHFDNAVKMIIALEVEKKQETTDLKGWLAEYRRQTELITKALKL